MKRIKTFLILQKSNSIFREINVMTLDEKYEQFRDDYFENAAELAAYFGIESVSKLLMSPSASMSKKDWLERELKQAIECENYQYCIKLKKELYGLQEDVRTDGEATRSPTT